MTLPHLSNNPDRKKIEKTKIIFVEDQKRGSLVEILETLLEIMVGIILLLSSQ